MTKAGLTASPFAAPFSGPRDNAPRGGERLCPALHHLTYQAWGNSPAPVFICNSCRWLQAVATLSSSNTNLLATTARPTSIDLFPPVLAGRAGPSLRQESAILALRCLQAVWE